MVEQNAVTLSLSKGRDKLSMGMKQTEIGLIPDDWEAIKLVAVSNLITKGTTPKQFLTSGINYVKIESFLNDKIILEKCPKISIYSHNGELKRSILEEDDLLFAIAGATIGKCAMVRAEILPANTNQALAIVRLNTTANSKFIFYSLKSNLMVDYINDNAIGGAQPNLNLQQVSSFHFPLPPLAEQEAIATALSDCDSWIGSIEQVLAKKRLIKQGAMQELLTLHSTGSGQASENWEVKKLGDMTKLAKSGGTPLSSNREFYNGSIPFLSISDMTNQGKYLTKTSNKISQAGIDNSVSWLVPVNSIIYSMYASVGFVSINKIELATSQAVLNLVFKDEYYLDYMYYFLVSIQSSILKFVGEGTQKNLNAKSVKNFEINIPKSLSEQTRIATILSDMDVEIEALEEKLQKARQIKQGMMQELLTGKTRLV